MNEYSVASPEDIEKFLKDGFVVIDDIPEDTDRRDKICMSARASILIESYCSSGHFQPFMKAGRHESSRWIYPLPKPYITKVDTKSGYPEFCLEFKEFAVYTGSMPEKDKYEADARWRLNIDDELTSHIKFEHGIIPNSIDNAVFKSDATKAQEDFIANRPSQFELCKHITPYNTPERVCRFFENEPYVFSALHFAGKTFRPDIFHDTGIVSIKNEEGKTIRESTSDLESLKEEHPEWSEETSVHEVLKTIIVTSKENANILELYEKCYGDSQKMVYPFKNQYGETTMKVVKLYDFDDSTSKLFIPVTTWMRSGSVKNQLFAVPRTTKQQPLYNLDLLYKKETSVVILTDSIEIADLNQKKCKLPGVVFTSFICDPGKYEQVDFNPLKALQLRVYYLISNHSGISLEVAYLKAEEMALHLGVEYKIYLKFIQLKANHTKVAHFTSLEKIITTRQKTPPQVIQDSVKIMEAYPKFQEILDKAKEFINSKPREWWEEHVASSEEQRLVKEEFNQSSTIDYILRPFLIRGEATMLFAGKSTGKSALALSMSAAITSSTLRPKHLFNEKWWTVPKSNYKRHKVLYLDFENGQKEIENRIKVFAHSYWPQKEEEREKCRENLQVIDMGTISNIPIDYSTPCNQQNIIDMIEDAKEKGEKGQPVDLLVIDTYTKFVNSENPQTSSNFADFINKIRAMKIALLILHHENDEGNARGLKTKLDSLYASYRLYRESATKATDAKGTKNLNTPMSLECRSYRGHLDNIQMETFKIKFDSDKKEWQVYDPIRNAVEELNLIVKFYEKEGFNREETAQMLGMGRSSLFGKKS